MAEAAPATPAPEATPPAAAAPAAPAPVPNIVADAAPAPAASAAPAAPAAPAVALAAVDPAVARAYLTEHGMTAEDAAKIPDADLAKKYDEAKAVEAAKPIEYKDFTLPEGVKLDDKLFSEIKSDFAKARLTQDQAQSFIDKHVAAVKASVDSNIAAFTKIQTDWRAEVMADPQIGGANFEAKTIPSIAKAIKTFCPDEASEKGFREVVSLTGIGNNPHYVRFMARLGASVMEGQPLAGVPAGSKVSKDFDSMAARLFPDQSKPQ